MKLVERLKKRKRHIVQLAVIGDGRFLALCDDGSVWYQYESIVTKKDEWSRIDVDKVEMADEK